MLIHSRIAVLAAMPQEEEALCEALGHDSFHEETVGQALALRVKEYRRGMRSLFVAQSGIGPVNAALALLLLKEHLQIDAVILLGVGGSLVPELGIGDVVASRRVLQHDSFASLELGDVRMAAGDLLLRARDTENYTATIESDAALLNALTAKALGKITLGTVLSGNEFVGTTARKRALQGLDPGAVLVDMEAAGVAQAARHMGVPFAVVKTVADRLNPDGSIESDFRACLDAAARNVSRLFQRIVSDWD